MRIEECLKDDTKLIMRKEPCSPYWDGKKKNSQEPNYYYKRFNHAEFIGEKLCSLRGIKCAHFFLTAYLPYRVCPIERYGKIKKRHPIIYLTSMDFKRREKSYFHAMNSTSLSEGCLNRILGLTPNKRNYEELQSELEELLALDTYMGQTDRHGQNILLEEDPKTREIHLAPLYDFEYSLKSGYIDPNRIYENALHPFRTIEDYYEFLEKHPQMKEKLKYYLGVRLAELAKTSYEERGLELPNGVLPFYEEFDEKRKELIKKITK